MSTTQCAVFAPFTAPSAETLFPRILLGIDFGSASLAAARWATTYVASGAHAIVSHVVPLPAMLPGDDTKTSRAASLRQMAPALAGGLGGFAATLNAETVRTVVRFGRPSHWLSMIANAADASLSVLGRRGDANRTRIGEPNVIERLARRTSASVLVVPEGTVDAPRHILAAVDESDLAPHVVRVARSLARLHDVPLTVLHVLSPVTGTYDRVIRSARQLLGGARRNRPAEHIDLPRVGSRSLPGRPTRQGSIARGSHRATLRARS